MNNYGKFIEKVDDSSKEFQQKCLAYNGNNVGKGIDIETLYYAKPMDTDGNIKANEKCKYYIFEYLKDDCDYFVHHEKYKNIPAEPKELKNRLTPWKSDPNSYKKNWRKFLALYIVANKLNGQLVLVNYSNGFIKDKTTNQYVPAPKGFDNEVKVMYVDTLDFDVLKQLSKNQYPQKDYIIFSEIKYMTFNEYAKWLQKMNQNCELPEAN